MGHFHHRDAAGRSGLPLTGGYGGGSDSDLASVW